MKALLLLAVSAALAAQTPIEAKTILVIGDSISAGYGIQRDQGWVALLESRVAALEAAVAELQGGAARPASTAPRGYAHPSLQVLGPGGGGDRCVMEPDKPCVQSHACRTFGH